MITEDWLRLWFERGSASESNELTGTLFFGLHPTLSSELGSVDSERLSSFHSPLKTMENGSLESWEIS